MYNINGGDDIQICTDGIPKQYNAASSGSCSCRYILNISGFSPNRLAASATGCSKDFSTLIAPAYLAAADLRQGLVSESVILTPFQHFTPRCSGIWGRRVFAEGPRHRHTARGTGIRLTAPAYGSRHRHTAHGTGIRLTAPAEGSRHRQMVHGTGRWFTAPAYGSRQRRLTRPPREPLSYPSHREPLSRTPCGKRGRSRLAGEEQLRRRA